MNRILPNPLAVAVSRRAGEGASADRATETLVGILREIELALGPVIGARGVTALLDRSLHRAALEYPWLADASDGHAVAPDFERLGSTLAARTGEEIIAAAGELLQAFHDLLTSLLGEALTRRLLSGVWSELLGGVPPQDTTS